MSASGGFHPFKDGTFPDNPNPTDSTGEQVGLAPPAAATAARVATGSGAASSGYVTTAMAPPLEPRRASRRSRRAAGAPPQTQARPAAVYDTGGISSGSEGKPGSGMKRINSLELFDFSFDEASPTAKNGADPGGAFSDQEIPYI